MGDQAAGGQYRGRGSQDLWRRAVVVSQVQHRHPGEAVRRECLLEAVEVAGVGSVPAVDGLVGVADDEQVVAVAQPPPQQPVLQRVDVLELVDEQVPEAPALGGSGLRVSLHDPQGEAEQVVEVDHPGLGLGLGIAVEQVRHLVAGQRRPSPGPGRPVEVLRGRDEAGRGPLDLGHHVLGLLPPPAEEVGDEPQLAVHEPGHLCAPIRPTGPQLGVGDGVERPRGDVVAQAEVTQPRPQLARRLAGEGEGEGMAGVQVATRRPVGDAPGEDPGLARAGAGVDAQGPGGAGHGGSLGLVEAPEQRVPVHARERTTRGRR